MKNNIYNLVTLPTLQMNKLRKL